MKPFTREEVEQCLKSFQEVKDRYTLRTYQVAPGQFEMACVDNTQTHDCYVLFRKENGDPWWNQVQENEMPAWWKGNIFGQEDFCQEDIEAAADYISSLQQERTP